MVKRSQENDPYIGIEVDRYKIFEFVASGKIGSIYKAEKTETGHIQACKVIKRLKNGWEREIKKVIELQGIDNIVPYHNHGSMWDKNGDEFTWILWDYIENINLRDYMKATPWPLDIAFIEDIIQTVLRVLFACRQVDIQHGDLHAGNILIQTPDRRIIGSPRKIWISDFGYGGSHNKRQPKDDFKQLFSISSNLLKMLDPTTLNPRDKAMHEKIKNFLNKKLLEIDPTQGAGINDIEKLVEDFSKLAEEAERESAAGKTGEDIREPSDYLAAEQLGNRRDEWKDLFVPEFLAVEDLLSKNITILTGARGCGKTMAFKRMTSFMDKVIGEPSGVKGSDQFAGFYMNCRDLVEAFPWIPPKLTQGIHEQITHYFHLSWFYEVIRTLASWDEKRKGSYGWMTKFVERFFGRKYHTLTQNTDVLSHVRDFVERLKEECRLTTLGRKKGTRNWPLARRDFLKSLQQELENNVSWIGSRALYFFLDDYTIPIVPRNVQEILNPIIFSRRSKLFFKISSESTNSFSTVGERGKPLELTADFELIDLATESLRQKITLKKKLLGKIFKPRIDRHVLFRGQEYSLPDILGKTEYNNNELAGLIRSNATTGSRTQRIYYHGEDTFVGMWSSDIRQMIRMFTEILRDSREFLETNTFELPIKKEIQNKTFRNTGGEFMGLMKDLTDPTLLEKGKKTSSKKTNHGTHLKDIVEAFVNISRYELTEGNLVKNQGQFHPKQAFRLEIIDKFDLGDSEASHYYKSLIRWHIFLQDWRGKSVRGMITPRIYLNRILLPYCNLTFSSRDNIHLTNNEFKSLLKKPTEFLAYWKEKRKKEMNGKNLQRLLFQDSQAGDE